MPVQNDYFNVPGALYPGALAEPLSSTYSQFLRPHPADVDLVMGLAVVEGTILSPTAGTPDRTLQRYTVTLPIPASTAVNFRGIVIRSAIPSASNTSGEAVYLAQNEATILEFRRRNATSAALLPGPEQFVAVQINAGVAINPAIDPVYVAVNPVNDPLIPVGAFDNGLSGITGLVDISELVNWVDVFTSTTNNRVTRVVVL